MWSGLLPAPLDCGATPLDAGRADSTGPGDAFGFTLIELLAVLIILAILCVAGLVRYQSMVDESRRKAATSLLAAAQSQLSLEFSRRLLNDLDLNAASQTVCDNVAIGTAGATTSLTCTGALDANVALTATVDGVAANASWTNPTRP